MNHTVTQERIVTRLGGREWKKTCACGLSVQHPKLEKVRAIFNAAHSLEIGIGVNVDTYEKWLIGEQGDQS